MKTAEVYDLFANKWAPLASMKKARGRFDIAVANDNVYAVGGSDGQKELDSAEMYDPSENVWKQLPKLPVARSNAGNYFEINAHFKSFILVVGISCYSIVFDDLVYISYLWLDYLVILLLQSSHGI